MSSILSFIKSKNNELEEKIKSDLHKEIENFSIKSNISMAKAAQSLNVLQTLRVSDHLQDFTIKIENQSSEVGHKFKDNSILLLNEGRLNGLSSTESELWLQGIYFKSSIEIASIEDLTNKTPEPQQKIKESRTLRL